MGAKKSVFISAGHSDTDPGASAFGRLESDIAKEFRNLVAFYLRRENIAFESDGTGDENKPLTYAISRAKLHSLALEFHCNASSNPAANGCEVLGPPELNAFSADISASIARTLSIKDRGAKPENAGQHSRLGFVRAGGIIVELFFLTNAADLDKYGRYKWLAARDIARAISWQLESMP